MDLELQPPQAVDATSSSPRDHESPDGSTHSPSRRGLAQPAFVLAVVAAMSAYVYAFDPEETSIFPTCPLYAATGLDCPTCGSTRAVHSLLHGDVGTALDHNVALVVLLPLLAYVFVRWAASTAGYSLPKLWRPWMRWPAVALIAVFFVARNLPLEPLGYLDAAAGP